ncbi:MAG: transglutaminase family protein [Deltaproteobacteria bacterium]|nr:transglutaminase family protein [Deltaproteobacteria bacterium]
MKTKKPVTDLDAELMLRAAAFDGGVWEAATATASPDGLELNISPLSTSDYSQFSVAIRNGSRRAAELSAVEVVLSAASPPPVMGSVLRATHRTGLRLSKSDTPVQYWMPLPRETDSQVPLWVQLYAEPREVLGDVSYRVDDNGNWGAVVSLPGADSVQRITLGWDAVVLVGRREPGADSEVAPAPGEWLRATDIVQSNIELIAQPAQTLALEGRSPEALLVSLLQWRESLYARPRGFRGRPPWWVDAASVVERRRATCTGSANLMAALGRAAGIPSRVVSGILLDTPQQTHYMVEAWLGPTIGWRLFEPQWTQDYYPRDDFVTLHVVSPMDESQDALSRQRFAAPGVPYWSMNEVISGWGRLTHDLSHPGIEGCRSCSGFATRVMEVRSTRQSFEDLVRTARDQWHADLGQMLAGESIACRQHIRAEMDAAEDWPSVVSTIQSLEGVEGGACASRNGGE